MKKLSRIIMVLIMLLGFSILIKHNLNERELGACEHAQNRSLVETKLESYPQCGWSGEYLPQQCNLKANTCWCVNPKGERVGDIFAATLSQKSAACPLNFLQRLLAKWQMPVRVNKAGSASGLLVVDNKPNQAAKPSSINLRERIR